MSESGGALRPLSALVLELGQPWLQALSQALHRNIAETALIQEGCCSSLQPRHILYYSNESLGCFKYHKTKTTGSPGSSSFPAQTTEESAARPRPGQRW